MENLPLLLEAEKRGILPADKQSLLAEARKRGLVPQAGGPSVMDPKPDKSQEFVKAIRKNMPGILGGQLAPDILKGMVDIPTGIAQSMSHVYEAIAPEGTFLESGAKAVREGVERQQKRQDDFYKRVAQPDKQFGSSVGRGAGQAVALGPLLAARPAATLIARMGQGAAIGGAAGAASPVEDGAEFWPTKASQIGTSAAMGAASVPVVEAVASVAPKVINTVMGWWNARPVKSQALSPQDVRTAVSAALKENGLDVRTVPTDVVNDLVEQAGKAMAAGRPLDNAALSRAADYKSIGVNPTAGQLSRDPAQFAFEQNVSGVKGIGDDIAARLGQQNQQLITKTGSLAQPSGDKYATGQSIIDALAKQNEAAKTGIRTAYQKAEQTVGAGAEVPLPPLAQRAGEVLETFGAENVPPVVVRRLQSYGLMDGKQTKSFTVEEAERLRKIINANMPQQGTPGYAASTSLLHGIDDSVGLLAEQGAKIGPEAANAFKTARELAKGRFKVLERTPALKAVAEGGALPDSFFDKYILRGNVTETEALKELVKANPAVVEDVRGQIIQGLQSAATNGRPADMAQFSAAAFSKAMRNIGDRRLSIFFSPQEIAQLKAIERVAYSRSTPPTGSPVNYSKSGSAVLDFANRMGLLSKVPMVGGFIEGAQNAAQKAAATAATNPSIPLAISKQLPPHIDDSVIDLFRQRAGIVGSGLLGFGAAGANQ